MTASTRRFAHAPQYSRELNPRWVAELHPDLSVR